jgi:hypothetical protein
VSDKWGQIEPPPTKQERTLTPSKPASSEPSSPQSSESAAAKLSPKAAEGYRLGLLSLESAQRITEMAARVRAKKASAAKPPTAAASPSRSLGPKAVNTPLRMNEGLRKLIEEGKL